MATTPDPFHANVSVIVLNYNRAAITLECLDALARAGSNLVKDVIVVDNGSGEDELAPLRRRHQKGDFTLVEVGVNRFFGEGNNIGVDFADSDYIMFLNNDAFVQPGCIDVLAATMRDDPTVAAVGPMFLYPDGRVQEVGGVVLPTGDAVQVGKGSVWGPDHYDTPCPVDYCSAACLMLRKSDFQKVGGFGYEWEPAYYEDTDLCLNLWTHCGKVMVNPLARVVHVESKTTSDSSLQLHDISEINRARFVKKWGPWLLARQLGAPGTQQRSTPAVPIAAPRPSGRLSPGDRLAVYSSYPVAPGGGERLLFEVASHFAELVGPANVVFATEHRYSTTRMRQLEATFGLGQVVGVTAPLDELDTDNVRFSLVIGNNILPAIPAFGAHSVYHIQFPFWVSDQVIDARRDYMSGYDEIWVYSDFVRRNVNGLLRHYDIDAAAHPAHLAPRHLAGRHGRAALAPASDRPERGAVLLRRPQQAPGRRHRGLPAPRRPGRDRCRPRSGGRHPPEPGGSAPLPRTAGVRRGPRVHLLPQYRTGRPGGALRALAVLVHAAGFGVDADEFPEMLEHFGITPIEAASFGCIPVVYGQGGPLDVVRRLGCATAFESVDECARIVAGLLRDPRGPRS